MVLNATYIANWHNIHNTKLTNTLQNNTRENEYRLPYTYKPGGQVFVSSADIKWKLASTTWPLTILKVQNSGTITIRRSTHVAKSTTFAVFTPSSNREASAILCFCLRVVNDLIKSFEEILS